MYGNRPMFNINKTTIKVLSVLTAVSVLVFSILDWSVDGFDFLKAQNHEFFFQSWISIAGLVFTAVMSITTFIVYKNTKIDSLKFVSLSFLSTSLAYLFIGYHTSYCKVCSDLTMCGTSHNYPTYFTVIAILVLALTTVLMNSKNNIAVLKTFSFGLIAASSLMLATLFMSIRFMEIPDIASYVLTVINFQGFVFVFPLILLLLLFIYFKTAYKVTKSVVLIFVLLFLSFLPQAYHIFICTECHTMECSEFYLFSGFFMFIAIGFLIYSISLQLQEKS